MYLGNCNNIAIYDADDNTEFAPALIEGTKDELLDSKFDNNLVFRFMVESEHVTKPTLLIFIIINH